MTRNLLNILTRPFKAFRQSPWALSSALPSRIDASLLVEEENSPYYEPAYFYPARIGEILNDRYQIATKLGHGSRSSGISGSHVCLVFEPLQTDLKPDNIMVQLEDHGLLSQDARDEFENPLPQKHCNDGRIIYLSRKDYGPLKKIIGLIEVVDFDLAVQGDILQDGCIQAEVYRAPEVIFDRGYTYSADIWSLGVMLWDFLEGRTLFESVDPHIVGDYDDATHLAYITSLLGPAPKDFVRRGKRTSIFYTAAGTLKREDLVPSNFSFESTISKFNGEEKRMYIKFVNRMIKWNPEERSGVCGTVEYFSGPFFDNNGRFLLEDQIPDRKLDDTASFLEEEEREAFLDFVKGMLVWHHDARKMAGELAGHPFLQLR
ncbi:uncharacterized protein N7518_005591 [Penicillium psychrosexuale]|uniref:uncharacterized protein n=1 Tax=Penicillium psychrosexuale TaxID=1002107 RepID=UPI002545BCC1|nr:uncharacterized protein N7518_005591 [Penicillium psychrosexuale]KAJ5797051.1 hypothetical protein N7518_005591 [Penicillium psychrosexuale]